MNTISNREVLNMLGEEIFEKVGMTELQARRAALLVKGLGPSEIAQEEGVARSSVSRSIEGAHTKALKELAKEGPQGQRSTLERRTEARQMRNIFGI